MAEYSKGDHTEEEKMWLLDTISLLARDNARTPVQ